MYHKFGAFTLLFARCYSLDPLTKCSLINRVDGLQCLLTTALAFWKFTEAKANYPIDCLIQIEAKKLTNIQSNNNSINSFIYFNHCCLYLPSRVNNKPCVFARFAFFSL